MFGYVANLFLVGLIIEKHCPLVIGHTNSPGGGYFKGYMDKVRDPSGIIQCLISDVP